MTVEAEGTLWQGKTVDLSQGGVKIAIPSKSAKLQLGTSVQLRLALPDNQPPVLVMGIVWRREPTSIALLFLGVAGEALERLKALVESFQTQLA